MEVRMLAKAVLSASIILGVFCLVHGMFMVTSIPLYALYSLIISTVWFYLAGETRKAL